MRDTATIIGSFLLAVFALFHARRGLVFNLFQRPTLTAKMRRVERVLWVVVGTWFLLCGFLLLLLRSVIR